LKGNTKLAVCFIFPALAAFQVFFVITADMKGKQRTRKVVEHQKVCRPLDLATVIAGVTFSREVEQRGQITESQNSRGWKGPLWVI